MKFRIKLFYTIVFLIALSSCSPWSKETDFALQMAGDNREELEGVLYYYHKENPDTLKLKAAEYLIANMVYQYSWVGSGVDTLNNYYKHVYGTSPRRRHDHFNSDSLPRYQERIKGSYDLLTINSDFLINQIEAAFQTYERFEWSRKYSFQDFCEYILPYKLGNSDTSNWRERITDRFGSYVEYFSLGGIPTRIEAEKYSQNEFSRLSMEGASEGLVHRLCKSDSTVLSIPFRLREQTVQRFFVDYFNPGLRAAWIQISVDDVEIGQFMVPSTVEVVGEKPIRLWFDFSCNLDSGDHQLRFQGLEGEVDIDIVHIPGLKKYPADQISLGNGVYMISNYLGNLNVIGDLILNESKMKVEREMESLHVLVERNVDGFYQLILEQDTIVRRVIDAFPFGESDRVLLFDNFNSHNQQWGIFPYEDGFQVINRGTGKILSVSSKDSTLVQLPLDSMSKNAIWYFEKVQDSILRENDTTSSILRVARRISEITNRFHWYGPKGNMDALSLEFLLDYTYGTCEEETKYQTMVLRSLGVASAVDFVINWADRPNGHSWSVIFDHEGNVIQNNCHQPVGTLLWWIDKRGKVYRKTNSINKKSVFALNNGAEEIPTVFTNPYFIDVTEQYGVVGDADIEVVNDLEVQKQFGYLMVFDNQDWKPIGWGERNEQSILFQDVEVNMMYLPSFYSGNSYHSFNAPFYLDSLGKVRACVADTQNTQRLILKRKYPNRVVNDWHHNRILGGKFQVANKSDFSDAVTICIIDSTMLDVTYHRIKVDTTVKFNYFRYLGPNGGHCNISEIQLFDSGCNEISGEIIGTSGSFWGNDQTKERVFDGDVLTYFDAPEPNGSWVGLKFDQPLSIAQIRFAARNDGNMIEIGDEYELVYWDQQWVSLGKVKATSDSLVFEEVPSNALYLLHNHTKGKEERIFTVDENGDQVWW